ncbi:hypothetical protein T11_18137 [Trichinella zimbabwensis]|uniref:Uncharacterized protein n=1 Tax=Trichinella zimbabwensis TaxID=268475 RepID=A0A0V1GFU3_9BILA|nr:hypothetical protein T11_18137 [Trichinella zimbabwensis]
MGRTIISNILPLDGLPVHHRDPAGCTRISDHTDLDTMSPGASRVNGSFQLHCPCFSSAPFRLYASKLSLPVAPGRSTRCRPATADRKNNHPPKAGQETTAR